MPENLQPLLINPMSKFLTGEELNKTIYDIIWEADRELLIVSPFIKLDDYFKQLFEKHKYNHRLHITIVFGRNEARPSKSLRKEDFEFFKQFKNISIIYCPPLHAKYYANDTDGLLTSINLYDASFRTNVEYGVYFPVKLSDLLISNAEAKAYNYTHELIKQHSAVFIKRPVYDKGLLSKSYIESSVLYDATDKILSLSRWNTEPKRYLTEFPEEVNANEFRERPERNMAQTEPTSGFLCGAREKPKGYCIRTGREIPFDLSRPMSYDAFQSWNQYKNKDYPENYCHKTGIKSNGKTSKRNPILK